jgi:type IV pilus assembly protein PilW
MGAKIDMKNLVKKLETPFSENGFTLIEILVAIAISGIVMAGVYSAYFSQQRSYVVQEQVAAAQQNLRAAMYFMEREIRMAGFDPAGGSDAAIITAQAGTLRLSEDISDAAGTGEPDGIIQPREDITYQLSGTDLRRITGIGGASESTQTIAENIQAINFIYLDADGAQTADIIAMRSIQINLRAGTGTNQRSLTTVVKCRNIGIDEWGQPNLAAI